MFMKMIKEIKGLEDILDCYFVDELGDVYSFSANGGKRRKDPKKLKQYVKTGGYLYVALVTESKKVRYLRTHRIVAMAFIDNPSNKKYVNHIDENRQNNIVDNLEWVTPKENNMHSLKKKMYVYKFDGELEKIYRYTRECQKDGYNQGHACACARNEIKSHKQRIFSYKPLTKEDVVQRLSKPHYLKGDPRKKSSVRE
ncbi:hypothetical protein CD122_01105 [Staphylococcus rostri]|uniref:HNH nuclease domain-containing protein n=2 Tax=Staphylococcus rostri TaxID=522262 RepID=A0A2K3YWE5_9STAP|nr:hypothetical protein CD122_01105 [Staphylococcus rostri]